MAQRRLCPPRIGADLAMSGFGWIGRLRSSLSQAEEARPGPLRAGDPPRDLRQRAVALASVLEAIIEHDDGMRASSPFAQEPRPGLQRKSWREGAGSVRLEFLGERAQPPLDRRSEP